MKKREKRETHGDSHFHGCWVANKVRLDNITVTPPMPAYAIQRWRSVMPTAIIESNYRNDSVDSHNSTESVFSSIYGRLSSLIVIVSTSPYHPHTHTHPAHWIYRSLKDICCNIVLLIPETVGRHCDRFVRSLLRSFVRLLMSSVTLKVVDGLGWNF